MITQCRHYNCSADIFRKMINFVPALVLVLLLQGTNSLTLEGEWTLRSIDDKPVNLAVTIS